MEPNLTAEEELIIECARITPDPGKIDELLSKRIDWSRITQHVTNQGLPTLAFHTLKPYADRIPPEPYKTLENTYYASIIQNMRITEESERITPILRKSGIDLILLKGLHLKADYYPQEHLRPMSDIDLLVRKDQLKKAAEILTKEDYVYHEEKGRSEAFCLKYMHHVSYMNGKKPAVVDLHWNIVKNYTSIEIPPEELWRDAKEKSFGDAEVSVLSLENLLIHLCVNLSHGNFFHITPLKSVCDIDRVVDKEGRNIDWQLLADKSIRWGCQAFVHQPLKLAQDIFQADIPAETLDRLEKNSPRRQLVWLKRQTPEKILRDARPRYDYRDLIMELAWTKGAANRLNILYRLAYNL